MAFFFLVVFPFRSFLRVVVCFDCFGFQKRASFGENGDPFGDGDLWLGGDVILHCDVTRGYAGVRGDWCGKTIFFLNFF